MNIVGTYRCLCKNGFIPDFGDRQCIGKFDNSMHNGLLELLTFLFFHQKREYKTVILVFFINICNILV